MKKLTMTIRGVGIAGGIWLVYQVIVSVQRAGYSSVQSLGNLVSIASTLLLASFLLIPWSWISKGPMWWPLIILFGFSSFVYLVLLLPSLAYGGGWVYFIALSVFLFVQITCILRMRNTGSVRKDKVFS